MKYFIVTGGSKGMGEFIIRNLFDKNYQVLCISRSINEELVSKAKELGVPTNFKSFDLLNVSDIKALVNKWKASIDKDNVEGLYLINNAGIIHPVNPFYECEPEEIMANVQINLIAPMILQAEFLKVCQELVGDKDIEQRVLNISSGAAGRAIQGWSSYCTSKAGLDMFTNCMVEDLRAVGSKVKVVAMAPGIVDTNMQADIRMASQESFTQVNQFKEYKEKGQLLKPEYVGNKIVEFIFSDTFGEETVTRIDRI